MSDISVPWIIYGLPLLVIYVIFPAIAFILVLKGIIAIIRERVQIVRDDANCIDKEACGNEGEA